MNVATLSDQAGNRPRALVTGLAGFTGRYVKKELEAAGYEVVGLDAAVDGSGIDIRDRTATMDMVAGVRPEVVIHLAAVSFVAHGDAEAIYGTNIVGTRNLLEALARAQSTPRVVILASSANVYGNAASDLPLAEDTPPAPANDYAVSKLAMEYMANTWREQLPLVMTRPFNYTGVGQGARFLLPKIVDHFRVGAEEIELGNLDVWRDFMDVRDVARAYANLVELSPSSGGIFNICSGRAYSLEDVLQRMQRIAGRSIRVTVNPQFVRANEVTRLVGSNDRLAAAIGDVSTIDLDETLRWMYEA